MAAYGKPLPMNEIFKIYKEYMDKQGCFLQEYFPAEHLFNGMRMEIKEQAGQGWAEILENDNGVCVSLFDYNLTRTVDSESSCSKELPHFSIILSGTFDVHFHASKQNYCILPGDIWFSKGIGHAYCSQAPGQKFWALTLYLPPSLMESWLGAVGFDCEANQALEKLTQNHTSQTQPIIPIARDMGQTTQLFRTVKDLFCADRLTLYGKLHFEALTLEILSQILGLTARGSRKHHRNEKKLKTAVEGAMDILRQESSCAPTISGLAHRVGVNECYLKSGFRKYTGLTIGEFIRKERMGKALELIETGRYSILETALFVGYSNPSYFSTTFRKFYGHLPSYYLPKGGRI